MSTNPKLREAVESRILHREEITDPEHFELSLEGIPLRGAIHNISSLGCLAVFPSAHPLLLEKTHFQNLHFEYFGRTVGLIEEARVVHRKQDRERVLLGLQFGHSKPLEESAPGEESRNAFRIPLLREFRPIAQSRHPFEYEKWIHFEALDLSRTGAKLLTSARNRVLLRATLLEPLTFHLPIVGSVETRAQVTFVKPSPEDPNSLEVGARFIDLTSEAEASLVKYLLNFSNLPIREILPSLQSAGFKPKYLKSHLDFTVVHTLEDYNEVLALRHRAYSRAGKVDGEIPASQMADVFDLNSRVIAAKHRGRIVGSVRLTTCLYPGQRFELEDSIEIPRSLPREECVEISRLCVDDQFHHTDLVLGLIERCVEFCIKQKVRYAITSCVEEMLEYYRKLGFKQSGKPFVLTTLNNIPHYFLVHDSRTHRNAHRLNPVFWHFAFSKVVEHLRRFEKLELEGAGLSPLKRMYLKAALFFFERTRRKRLSTGAAKPPKVEK